MFLSVLLLVAFVPMLWEAHRSRSHEPALRRLGAVEPPGDVYRLMQVAYPACFALMVLEAALRGRAFTAVAVMGAVVFITAKALKYWAIAALGPRWTFRVLVPPGSHRTTTGPYRFLRHPNYLGVVGELAGMALLAQAPIAGPIAMLLFGALVLARIRVEERALGLRAG
jgi:methyltransferase